MEARVSYDNSQLFQDDVVCLKAKNTSIGVISRVAWIADSDDEHWEFFEGIEDDNLPALKPDHVEVMWTGSLNISEVLHNKLRVIDRGLVHGDVVASSEDPQGQTGVVTDVVLSVDLLMLKNNQRVQKVFCRYLSDIHPFMLGRHVTTKTPPRYVGTIDDVIYDVEVRFNDGSRCILHDATPEILKINEDDVSSDEEVPTRNYLYYPSQVVSATEAVWASAEWIVKPKEKENRKQKKKKQRVPGKIVKVTPTTVVVSWVKQFKENNLPENCKPDDLIVLNQLKHTKLEVGDYVMIHPEVKAYFLKETSTPKPSQNPPKGKNTKANAHKQKLAQAQLETQKRQEAEDKRRQNPQTTNQEEKAEPEIETTPSLLDVTDIVPADEELTSHLSSWSPTEADCCIVTCTHTTVKVRWQDNTTSEWMPSTQLLPRKYLLSCNFWPGDFVINKDNGKAAVVSTVNETEKTCQVMWLEGGAREEVSVYGIVRHPNRKFRLGGVVVSATNEDVGEVLERTGDTIRVAWSGSNKVTVERSEVLKAVDTDDEDEVPSEDENEKKEEVEDENKKSKKEKEKDEAGMSTETELSLKCPFAIVEEIPDHHFVNEKKPPAKITRFAMKEWKRLQNGLPPNIFVIGCSKDTHLLRALVVGPEDTIFFNSYFIFDIFLPHNYPAFPPKVYYRSGGYKVHPNLYEDGTVCLSLLGTWSGDQSERWKPSQSSILQIVVSIQGLILGVKDPYFLEAGYEKLKGTKQGMLSSRTFNELSLINSIKQSINYFKNPPSVFKTVLREHFLSNVNHLKNLITLCTKLEKNEDLGEYKNTKSLYCIHDNPSKGFLKEVLGDLKKKIEE